MNERKYILTKEVAEKKLRRLALEIIEHNLDEKELILAGIRGSGTVVAACIQKNISELSSIKTKLITLTLDKKLPEKVLMSEKVDFNDKVVIVIDDVANSGKTLLYALKPLLDFHPKKIQTLIMVERSHKEFPVAADYVGQSIASTLQEHIYVEVNDTEILGAYLQ
jgi:pyrimidine operon attenuation protein / uracil phosphoribosyltransferase